MKRYLAKYNALYVALSEDARKVGAFCIGAGWVGIFVEKDKMSSWAGVILLMTGIFLSSVGLYLEHKLSIAKSEGGI